MYQELTRAEVTKIVAEVNAEVLRERLCQWLPSFLLAICIYPQYVVFVVEEGVASINAAMAQDIESLFRSLQNENVGVLRVERNNVPHYQTLLESSRASKVEVKFIVLTHIGSVYAWRGERKVLQTRVVSKLLVHHPLQRTGNPSASLSLEEIQSVVDLANVRTKETIEGECVTILHGN